MKRLVILVALVLVTLPLAAQRRELWDRWTAHDPASTATIDHSEWQWFLDTYLVTGTPSGVFLVRYGDVTAADRARLDAYVASLEATRISSFNRDEQYAFWFNLYNAYTVKLILDNYPVDSIRDISISPGLFSRGPWGAKLMEIEGEELSLDDVEHRILRPIWDDPRIHYGVNCASIGCPNLRPEAFTAANVDRLLTVGANEYVNDPRGVSFSGNRMTVSSIYNWFQEDFGGNVEGVIDHLLQFAEPELAERIRAYDGRVRYEYDWSLNEP